MSFISLYLSFYLSLLSNYQMFHNCFTILVGITTLTIPHLIRPLYGPSPMYQITSGFTGGYSQSSLRCRSDINEIRKLRLKSTLLNPFCFTCCFTRLLHFERYIRHTNYFQHITNTSSPHFRLLPRDRIFPKLLSFEILPVITNSLTRSILESSNDVM